MQEPFSSLPSTPLDARQALTDVRTAGSAEGYCDLSLASGMTGSGDASVASEVLPSSSASLGEQQQQQQQQILAIEPHNPFFDNTSIVSTGSTGGPATSGLCQEVPLIAPVPLLAASQSTDAPFDRIHVAISPASHSTTTNHSAHQTGVFPQQQQSSTAQPSITASSEAEEDDEDTAPSSTGRGPLTLPTDVISRLIENTKRFLQRKDSEDDDDDDSRQGLLIAGYLQKLGRNGKWQTRWFETDGECLSYYKNQKRTKLLATLELQKVGLIEIEPEDATECSFRIQVLGRDYHLRASNRGSCKDWVINLNRVKEAKLGQGGVRLVGPRAVDLLDPGTPKLVVEANRQRTRAVDEQDQWDRLIRSDNDPVTNEYTRASALSGARLSTAVVGRWSKRRTTLHGVGSKLSRWARSLKKYSCAEIEREKIFLDQHVHPPGHDDKMKKSKRPEPLHDRSISTASDYDVRILS